MKLELANYPVGRIILGDKTKYVDGELHVNPNDVRDLMFDEEFFEDISVHVAHPGDSTRIIHVVDVVEPRHKQSGTGCVFPGVLGPPAQVGNGRTAQLSGMAVVSTSTPAAGEGYYWREAICDMSGPGARISPFSENANLVLELSPRDPGPEIPAEDIEMINTIRGSIYSQKLNLALRKAQMGLASYLAETVSGSEPASVDTYELTEVDPALPKVAYVLPGYGRDALRSPDRLAADLAPPERDDGWRHIPALQYPRRSKDDHLPSSEQFIDEGFVPASRQGP